MNDAETLGNIRIGSIITVYAKNREHGWIQEYKVVRMIRKNDPDYDGIRYQFALLNTNSLFIMGIFNHISEMILFIHDNIKGDIASVYNEVKPKWRG